MNDIIQHAYNWAKLHRKCTDQVAMQYAEWYFEHYPEGNKEHSTAFDYWEWSK